MVRGFIAIATSGRKSQLYTIVHKSQMKNGQMGDLHLALWQLWTVVICEQSWRLMSGTKGTSAACLGASDDDGQQGDEAEMSVRRCEVRAMFQRGCGDPDVILGNRPTHFTQ